MNGGKCETIIYDWYKPEKQNQQKYEDLVKKYRMNITCKENFAVLIILIYFSE